MCAGDGAVTERFLVVHWTMSVLSLGDAGGGAFFFEFWVRNPCRAIPRLRRVQHFLATHQKERTASAPIYLGQGMGWFSSGNVGALCVEGTIGS